MFLYFFRPTKLRISKQSAKGKTKFFILNVRTEGFMLARMACPSNRFAAWLVEVIGLLAWLVEVIGLPLRLSKNQERRSKVGRKEQGEQEKYTFFFAMSLICITFATPKQESPAIAAALKKGAMDIMHWIILIVAGLCEVGFTYCLGRARTATGLEWWSWMAGFIVFTVLSMGMLAKATHHIPLGTAYPVWTGIGAAGTVLVGILVFHEPATFWRLFFITTLVASIIGLKALS